MKIEISYPGQEIRIVNAPPHIVEHFETKGYDLPFIKVIKEDTEEEKHDE